MMWTILVACALLTEQGDKPEGTVPASKVEPAPATPASGPELLQPATYHEGDVAVEDGSTWTALVEDADGWRAVEVSVGVSAVHDPCVDSEGEASGVKVVSSEEGTAWLVRGLPVELGEAMTLTKRLEPGPLRLAVGESVVALEVARDEDRIAIDVSADGHSASLPELVLRDEGGATLHWVGDLDGDGELDLIIDMAEHYAASRLTLFLSSKDWAPVARLHTSGC